VRVYDATGRVVRTLVDADHATGEWEAAWDGRSDAGALVGPGVYFARLASAGGVRTARVVSVR
jgi:flagellar hook assembly protein FlgD